MANKKSAQKRVITNEKRRQRNSQEKSSVRTASKKVVTLLGAKGEKDAAELTSLQRGFEKKLDTAAKKGIYHWKTAARLKSRMAKKVNSAV